MFNGPNYKLVSSYINNQVSERPDPADAEFNNAIAQSVKFDKHGLRGDANQLRQELHGIISQAEYTGMDDEKKEETPMVLHENSPWNTPDQSYLNSCRPPMEEKKPDQDGYYTDGYYPAEERKEPFNKPILYEPYTYPGYGPSPIWEMIKTTIVTIIVIALVFIILYYCMNAKPANKTVGAYDDHAVGGMQYYPPAEGLNI